MDENDFSLKFRCPVCGASSQERCHVQAGVRLGMSMAMTFEEKLARAKLAIDRGFMRRLRRPTLWVCTRDISAAETNRTPINRLTLKLGGSGGFPVGSAQARNF